MLPGTGLRPSLILPRLADLAAPHLEGRRALLIDVDNTLLLLGGTRLDDEVPAALARLKREGAVTGICLITNSVRSGGSARARLDGLARMVGARLVTATWRHLKPHPAPFRQGLRLLRSLPEETCVIGDQLFTDVRGGNALGLRTIWVRPLGPDAWFTRPKRWLERRVSKNWSA